MTYEEPGMTYEGPGMTYEGPGMTWRGMTVRSPSFEATPGRDSWR